VLLKNWFETNVTDAAGDIICTAAPFVAIFDLKVVF
jgi:hypothetical protein